MSSSRRGSLITDGPVPSTPRRASVPQGAGSSHLTALRRGSKPSFLGAGRRVSMLVKYKQAFQNRHKPPVPEEEEEEEDKNPMAPIRELPHSPRFSTFLSAEAQYALMKGYEDKLYERISDSNPEVRASLQRSKTPFQKISIVDPDKQEEEEEEEEDGDESPREFKSVSSFTSSGHTTLPSRTRTLSVSVSPKPLDNRSTSSDSPTPSTTPTTSTTISVPYLKPLRRQSLAADVNGNAMIMAMSPLEDSLEKLHMQRSLSLPTLDPPGGMSLNKRLVLTYRLESAMDLLDTLKQKDKENSLSPRVVRGHQRQGDVVRNFNSWAQVWNKEFKEIQTK